MIPMSLGTIDSIAARRHYDLERVRLRAAFRPFRSGLHFRLAGTLTIGRLHMDASCRLEPARPAAADSHAVT